MNKLPCLVPTNVNIAKMLRPNPRVNNVLAGLFLTEVAKEVLALISF